MLGEWGCWSAAPVRLRFRVAPATPDTLCALRFGWCGVGLPSRSSREQSEGWRPGLDLNQDKEHCTALASTLPPPGRAHLSRLAPLGPLLVAVNPTSLCRPVWRIRSPHH